MTATAVPGHPEFLRDAIEGLARAQRALPGKYLWDEAGSVLYDQICGSADYYIARCETGLLRRAAHEIAAIVGSSITLVEFGSGASHKIRELLDAMAAPARYVAVDISEAYLVMATQRIARDYPAVEVAAICADYTKPLSLPTSNAAGSILGFFPGSTIGNFAPADVVAFLKRARAALGPSWFLIGADPTEDGAMLTRAYSGADGLMAAFHKNVLVRANRELGTCFDPDDFRHEARVLDHPRRVEAHLVAERPIHYQLDGLVGTLAPGESIHTDTSYKMKPEIFQALAVQGGWSPLRCWSDDGGLFNLHLLRARSSTEA